MNEDQETDMAACKQFLFMIPPDRLKIAAEVLATVYAESDVESLRDHLVKVRSLKPYRGLHLRDQR